MRCSSIKKAEVTMFKVLKTEGAARRGEFSCPHGTVQTPVFMNVGTQAAIKGALSATDLEGFRRLSGVFAGRAPKDQRGGRDVCLSPRRPQDLYGAGGEHAHPVESRLRYRYGV